MNELNLTDDAREHLKLHILDTLRLPEGWDEDTTDLFSVPQYHIVYAIPWSDFAGEWVRNGDTVRIDGCNDHTISQLYTQTVVDVLEEMEEEEDVYMDRGKWYSREEKNRHRHARNEDLPRRGKIIQAIFEAYEDRSDILEEEVANAEDCVELNNILEQVKDWDLKKVDV